MTVDDAGKVMLGAALAAPHVDMAADDDVFDDEPFDDDDDDVFEADWTVSRRRRSKEVLERALAALHFDMAADADEDSAAPSDAEAEGYVCSNSK